MNARDEAERKLIEAGQCMGVQSNLIDELTGLLKEIDTDLALQEDSAHGIRSKVITELRGKIQSLSTLEETKKLFVKEN